MPVSFCWRDPSESANSTTSKAVAERSNCDTTVLLFDPAASEPVWLGYIDSDTWRFIKDAGGADSLGRYSNWSRFRFRPGIRMTAHIAID